MKKFFNLKSNRGIAPGRGFTIIETLVAVSILMISIAGPLTVAQKGLMAALFAKDQVIASFLAQDAMEYLKNSRDSLGYDAWYANLNGAINCNKNSNALNECKLDTIANTIEQCNGGGCNSSLYFNDGVGYTTRPGGNVLTIFKRRFYLDTTGIVGANAGNEAKVVVTISWQNGTVTNNITLENQFYDVIR